MKCVFYVLIESHEWLVVRHNSATHLSTELRILEMFKELYRSIMLCPVPISNNH
jgi:hypothetical protein